MNLQAVECPKCRRALSSEHLNAGMKPCPNCSAVFRAEVFPALFRNDRTQAEDLVLDDEASCFFHSQKRAVAACDGCGRFVCKLCEVQLAGQQICPDCVGTQMKTGAGSALERRRFLWHKLTVALALVNLFVGTCTAGIPGIAAVVTGVIAIRKPPLVYQKSAWLNRLTAVVGIVLGLIWVGLIFVLYASAVFN